MNDSLNQQNLSNLNNEKSLIDSHKNALNSDKRIKIALIFFFVIVSGLVLGIISGVFILRILDRKLFNSTVTSFRNNPALSYPYNKFIKRNISAPGIITKTIVSSNNPDSDNSINSKNVFAPTDKNIFMIVKLFNVKTNTKISYIRYLNNKFLDNRSIIVKTSNTDHIVFDWSFKKDLTIRPIGEYRIRVFTNGIYEQSNRYTVK